MTPDPRWLEVLKASSWQLGAVSLALALFWLLLRLGVLPPLESTWIVYGLPLGILVTGALALFGLLEWGAGQIGKVISARRAAKAAEARKVREREEFRAYLPFMTESEKRIFGWLLQFREKSFYASYDGDNAATLLGRGFVRPGWRNGQAIDPTAAPFIVPDHLWEVLEENADKFPKGFERKGRRPWHSL